MGQTVQRLVTAAVATSPAFPVQRGNLALVIRACGALWAGDRRGAETAPAHWSPLPLMPCRPSPRRRVPGASGQGVRARGAEGFISLQASATSRHKLGVAGI